MTLAAGVVLLPVLAACTGLALGRARPGLVAPVAVAGAAAALLLAVVLAATVLAGSPAEHVGATIPTGGPLLTVTLLADGLSAVVAVAVTVVALLVQVYSVGYLRGDPRYSSYAAVVSLFTGAMLLVVLAGDLLVLYVGWEIMGLCSYLLVGHHWERHEARAAAVKAFLTTRIGDVLLLFGFFALGTAAGSFRVVDVLGEGAPATVVLLLVLGGAVGKSAQFPLHVWLPDAMAGPTPVSALIHAATMVAAGVFVVVRLWPLYAADAAALAVLAVVAAATMVGAALAAVAQDDLKRVLAWSTVSQLALMFGALAVGAPGAATFHLLTHAAFKALLFLCAGSVMHAVGTALMRDMGGLRRELPLTFATMTVGLAALVGVPPLSGFLSKEAVLTAAEETALHGGVVTAWVGWLVLVAALATVGLTGAYATRAWLRTFFGERRGTRAGHEAEPVMAGPLVALAVLAVGAGLLLPVLPGWLAPGGADAWELSLSPVTTVLSLVLAAAGGLGAWAVWRRDPARDPALALGRLRPVLAGAFGVDALYDAVVVGPVRGLARVVVALDRDVIDAYVRGTGLGAGALGGALRTVQRGPVQRYVTVVLAGAVLLAVSVVVTA